jgi:type VI secretion system secreted protein VgrG
VQNFQLVFINEDLPAGASRVTRLDVSERMSQPFRIEAQLDVLVADLEPRTWLLKSAEVQVFEQVEGRLARRYVGTVTAVTEDASRAEAGDTDAQRVTVVLEPSLAALRTSRNHRIFQNQTTEDIVSTLLEEGGVTLTEWRLTGSYPEREVCTQFAEPTMTFIARILEEDGIFYFSEHGDDGEKLVFGDAASAYAEAVVPTLPFRGGSGLMSGEAIFELSQRRAIRPSKVTLRDHDFKHPALDLEVEAEAAAPLEREHYDYPGRYVDPGEGKRRAQVRVDAMKHAAESARGRGNAFALTPGHTFTLEDAPAAELDREWLVVAIDHRFVDRGQNVEYHNSFELLPADVDYRPPALAPRAIVPGPQLAIVVGPAGEEVHCDEFGRVKVHYYWDRESKMDDKSSCWVRVGQMHTSGSIAIPRVGWEVMIDYEDGDPDRPYILGRVYNPMMPPPYPLPAKKTVTALKSTSSPGKGGYNEIRMDDAGGSQMVQTYAQKDQNVVIGNNKTEKVSNNVSASVGANHTVGVGANETVKIGASATTKVAGSQTWTVGGSRTVSISEGSKSTVKGDRKLTIGGSHTIMTPMSVSYATPASLAETIGGSCIDVAALEMSTMVIGAITQTISGAKIEACADNKGDTTLGARACTVGGAFVQAAGADVGTSVGGAKATTVGGAWAATSAGAINFEAGGTLQVTVGGAVSMNGAKVVMKVGGSSVTLQGGNVVLKSRTIKLTATGPQPETSAGIEDK